MMGRQSRQMAMIFRGYGVIDSREPSATED